VIRNKQAQIEKPRQPLFQRMQHLAGYVDLTSPLACAILTIMKFNLSSPIVITAFMLCCLRALEESVA
jgi:hypothetical protein